MLAAVVVGMLESRAFGEISKERWKQIVISPLFTFPAFPRALRQNLNPKSVNHVPGLYLWRSGPPGLVSDWHPKMLGIRYELGDADLWRAAPPALGSSCGIDSPALPSLCETFEKERTASPQARRAGPPNISPARQGWGSIRN